MSFSTFALYKFFAYYIKQTKIKRNDVLNKYLEDIINKIFQEHFELFKSNKDIFLKSSKDIVYNKLKEKIIQDYIKSKSIRKNINKNKMLEDFKEFFQENFNDFNSVSEEITSEICNIKNIPKSKNRYNSFSDSKIVEINEKNAEKGKINHSLSITYSTNTNNISTNSERDYENENNEIIGDNFEKLNDNNQKNYVINIDEKKIEEKDIQDFIIFEYVDDAEKDDILEYTNNTYFLEDIDDYYIYNIKKDIMNNIFSIYFIDTFFYNNLFKRMKIYYLNNYTNAEPKTKVLNFPSKIKRFNNGLNPDNILKLNYKFFSDKYFPISHPYFYDYMSKRKISPNKYIKLFDKKIELTKNKNIIQLDCELIKIDKYYFGKIFYSFKEDKNKFLIFQEHKKDFKDCNESIFDDEKNGKNIFSLSFLFDKMDKDKTELKFKNQVKRKQKVVIIHLENIEEIIEKRFLLMWQALEIYLKNGKSYFFNFLSEDNKNTLLNWLAKDKEIKKLIHKRDYFSMNKLLNRCWKNGAISTFENLLLLNKYGSRSFNDSSQYPVFPWILLENYNKIGEINHLNDIKEKNLNEQEKELLSSSLRDFKYPICMQNENRREDVKKKFIEEEEFKHHLGIHYSTSSFIYYYLMRQQPYCNLLLKLQNYQTEDPNRVFICLVSLINSVTKTNDSREIIPELFFFFEYLINLNCDFYGIKSDNSIVDDNNILSKNMEFSQEKSKNPFFKYVYFIIEHQKLLNSKLISKSINNWIDNIFGEGQYPSSLKKRQDCCNIFIESSYEQFTDLKTFYLDKVNEAKSIKTKEKKIGLLKSFLVELNLVVNFGQIPYQIFTEKYNKREYKEIKKENKELENYKESEVNEFIEINFDKINNKNKIYNINEKEKKYYNYFEINPNINKIFVFSEEGFMEVINSTLYSDIFIKDEEYEDLYHLINFQLKYFSFKKETQNSNGHSYFLGNIKYAFSSFENNYDETKKNMFKTYARRLIEKFRENNKKKEVIENDNFKLITCQYANKTFKIHQLPMDKKNKKKMHIKTKSFVCEDFVNSCCAISFCQFLLGLKNGKLIQCHLDKNLELKLERNIKCHKGKVNAIEINKKYGLIITCGDDNYILIRKLYDFELLSPIKIKDKFIIIFAKVSPLNFLYVLCFNKQKNSKIILGYTLNGIKFAKSEYGNYETIDFTENGNIVTFQRMGKLYILSGSNLDSIKMERDSQEFEVINKIINPIWLKYEFFLRKERRDEYIHKKIITYINDKNSLINLDVSDNYFFN